MEKIVKTIAHLVSTGNLDTARKMVEAADSPYLSRAFRALLTAERTVEAVNKTDLVKLGTLIKGAPDNVPGRQAKAAWKAAHADWPEALNAPETLVQAVREAFTSGHLSNAHTRITAILAPVVDTMETVYRAESLARRANTWKKEGKATTLAWSSR